MTFALFPAVSIASAYKFLETDRRCALEHSKVDFDDFDDYDDAQSIAVDNPAQTPADLYYHIPDHLNQSVLTENRAIR
jgi:hypothetical protein